MTKNYDAILVGGGHNGLTCAAYLARAGKSVLIIEKRAILGGAAVTEEFYPGFSNSTCSYTVSLLNPAVIKDLSLYDHGLTILTRKANNYFPQPAGGGLLFSADADEKRAAFAALNKDDADALPRFESDLDRAADILRGLLMRPPPNVEPSIREIVRTIRLGMRLAGLGRADKRLMLALATESADSFLRRYFTHSAIRAAFAFDGVVGTYASPFDKGTAYVLLHHAFGEVNGQKSLWGHAVGGMGAISTALWKSAEAHGAAAITDAEVDKILVNKDKAIGVRLADGREFLAPQIAVNTTPKILTERLLKEAPLATGDRAAFDAIQYGSATFRMNVALRALPIFPGMPCPEKALTSGIVIGPDMDYLDKAYLSARSRGFSNAPIVEMLIPSTLDDSLAPSGQHVASLFCQHFPYDSFATDNAAAKEKAIAAIFGTIESFAPGFKDLVIGYKAYSPVDLEAEFGLTRGDIFHGCLSFDQLFSARPVIGYARHEMPIKGVYLCGSGAHPGGGVTGVPGRNAALVMLGKA